MSRYPRPPRRYNFQHFSKKPIPLRCPPMRVDDLVLSDIGVTFQRNNSITLQVSSVIISDTVKRVVCFPRITSEDGAKAAPRQDTVI